MIPPGQSTLTLRLYNYLHYGASEEVAGLSLLLTVLGGCLWAGGAGALTLGAAAGGAIMIRLDGSANPMIENPLIRDASFDLPDGSALAILGPSGSGKTTPCG